MLTRSKQENFVRWFDKIDDSFWNEFERKRIAAVRSVANVKGFGRVNVVDLCKRIGSDLRDTFSVEYGNAIDSSVISSTSRHSWYVSFIVQNDKRVLDKFVESLPVSEIPSHTGSLKHSNAVWVFIGQNLSSKNFLDGRAEHTDSLSDADATWHCQTRGTKLWFVRPSATLMKMFDCKEDREFWQHTERVCIEMQRGDLLLIDTQLWWHHTKIPSTVGSDRVSLSYARDIRLNRDENFSSDDKTILTNIDCVYASNDISRGDVVLTEHDLPDCELSTSSTPNCLVTEDDTGTGILIALRDIKQGEIFTVAS